MKGYLIDPLEKRVREFNYDGDQEKICHLIGSDFFDTCAINDAGDAVYVGEFSQDDEMASKFKIQGHPQVFFGKGVILGVDEDGMTCEPSMTLEEIRSMMTYKALMKQLNDISGP